MIGKYGTFGSISPTRSPGCSPRSFSRPATREAAPSSAGESSSTASSFSAGRPPWRSAVRVSSVARFMGLLLRECVVDAGGGHCGPLVVHGVGEQHQVAQLAAVVADVVVQQPLGVEAQAG